MDKTSKLAPTERPYDSLALAMERALFKTYAYTCYLDSTLHNLLYQIVSPSTCKNYIQYQSLLNHRSMMFWIKASVPLFL